MKRSPSDLAGMRACILAGGLGLRLRSAVPDRPKALAPIAGRPFLDYLLRQVAVQGVRAVTICSGYGSTAVRDFVADGQAWDLAVTYSEEREPLGTAGAVRLAMESFAEDAFLVLNGDSFFDINFDQLVAGHRAADAAATMAVRWTADPGRFGSVEVDEHGRVRSFREKQAGASALINGGIYVLTRRALAGLRPGESVSMERDVFPSLTCPTEGVGLCAVAFDGWFTDIGVPDDYTALDREPTPIRAALARGSEC